MSWFSDEGVKVGEWFLIREWPTLARSFASAAAGYLATGKFAAGLSHWGVTVDPSKFSTALVAVLTGAAVATAIHAALHWLSDALKKANASK